MLAYVFSIGISVGIFYWELPSISLSSISLVSVERERTAHHEFFNMNFIATNPPVINLFYLL